MVQRTLGEVATPKSDFEIANKKYVDDAIINTNVLKTRSFKFDFGNPLSAGVTAISANPTSYLKTVDLGATFGINFFGTDVSKIMIQLTVLANTQLAEQDAMLASVRRFIDQNAFVIVMRRMDANGAGWGALQDVFITVEQIQ